MPPIAASIPASSLQNSSKIRVSRDTLYEDSAEELTKLGKEGEICVPGFSCFIANPGALALFRGSCFFFFFFFRFSSPFFVFHGLVGSRPNPDAPPTLRCIHFLLR